MKLQIKCVNDTKERFQQTETVFAERENQFEIEVVDDYGELQDKDQRAELLNMKEGDQICWTVSDEDKETVLFSKESPVTDQFSYTISKKLSGEYYYALQASVTGRKDQVDELRIKGYCEPKVLKTSIESDADGDLCFGHIITVLSEAEGVNGNNIKVEIYNEIEICVANLDTKCREGDIRREGFDTMGWHSKCKEPGNQEEKEEYTFTVRIKDREEYVKDAAGNLDVFEFTIKNKDDAPATTVDNNMIAIVDADQTNLSPEPEQVGVLVLESALVNTSYTVTNDEVNDKNIDHWILKDGNGKKCHWAKSEYREAITKQNIDDEKDEERKRIKENIINNGYKPNPLPVMLPSTKKLKITAWFKVIIPFEVVSIRLTDINKKKDRNEQEVKYIFDPIDKSGGKKDELFKLEFECESPYKNQVQHFEKFQLLPEYKLDGEPWIPMEMICFELYITWKNPTNLSKEIPESLLRFGCEYASNCSTEEEIVEKAFFSFNQKGEDGVPRIYRVREGKIRPNNQKKYLERNFPKDEEDIKRGMGYWRGISTQEASVKSGTNDFYNMEKNIKYPRTSGNDIVESGKFLLKYGEARCGEWTHLFICALYVHGISGCECIHILTDQGRENYNKENDTTYQKSEDHIDGVHSFLFAVKNAKLSNVSAGTEKDNPTHSIYNNYKSLAQGNSNAHPTFLDHIWCYYKSGNKFYDASYAVSCESVINVYCVEFLNNLSYEKEGEYHLTENEIHKYVFSNIMLF